MNRRYYLALDLVDDAELIREYERFHQKGVIWPEIVASIKESGVLEMEIYRTGNRLFMIMEVAENFSFEKKAEMDAANKRVEEWEQLMWQFQQRLPWSETDQKWVVMESIFSLSKM